MRLWCQPHRRRTFRIWFKSVDDAAILARIERRLVIVSEGQVKIMLDLSKLQAAIDASNSAANATIAALKAQAVTDQAAVDALVKSLTPLPASNPSTSNLLGGVTIKP